MISSQRRDTRSPLMRRVLVGSCGKSTCAPPGRTMDRRAHTASPVRLTADLPDREAVETLGRLRMDSDIGDTGRTRATIGPGHHRVDGVLGALEDRLDPPVPQVADPAVDPALRGH